MKKPTKRDKWVERLTSALIDGECPLIELRKQMAEDGLSGTAMNKCIAQAKERIKEEANDVKEMAYDLNMLRLNTIADNAAQTADSLSAIDKMNKMIGAYTQNINIAENVRFILGDQEAFENGFTENAEEE